MLPNKFRARVRPTFTVKQQLEVGVHPTALPVGEVLTVERLKIYVDEVYTTVAEAKAGKVAALNSLSVYLDKEITQELSEMLAWRVAAGIPVFNKNITLEKDFTRRVSTWATLWIENLRPVQYTTSKRTEVDFRVLSGVFAGLSFSQKLSNKYLSYIAKELGWPRYTAVDIRGLTQFVLAGKITTTRPGRPTLTEFAATGGIVGFNSELRRSRKEACPRGFSWACEECSVGYRGSNSCPRATRKFALRRGYCPRCRQRSTFDITASKAVCFDCYRRNCKTTTKENVRASTTR